MIDEKYVFDLPVKVEISTFCNIQKIATGQSKWLNNSLSTKFCLFKEYYKMIATDLSKEKTQDIDPKSIKQIDYIENSEQSGNKPVLLIL